jgi:hypothetical protein
MRVVLDTNVLVSGIFFSGPPSRILKAWRSGRLTLVYSPPIFEEYERVLASLADEFPSGWRCCWGLQGSYGREVPRLPALVKGVLPG